MRTHDPAKGDQILASAARLFHRRHYHEVRMDDVAADAKVAKGTIYRYFQNKEDLYLGLILSSIKQFVAEIAPMMTEDSPAPERLRSYIYRSVAFCDRNPYFLDLVQRVEGGIDPARLAPLNEARRQIIDIIVDVIRDLNVEGRYRAPRPDVAAIALTGMIRQIMRFLPKPWPANLADILAEQFLHGLCAPKKPAKPSTRPRKTARSAR